MFDNRNIYSYREIPFVEEFSSLVKYVKCKLEMHFIFIAFLIIKIVMNIL
jgi:hypothetical protein